METALVARVLCQQVEGRLAQSVNHLAAKGLDYANRRIVSLTEEVKRKERELRRSQRRCRDLRKKLHELMESYREEKSGLIAAVEATRSCANHHKHHECNCRKFLNSPAEIRVPASGDSGVQASVEATQSFSCPIGMPIRSLIPR